MSPAEFGARFKGSAMKRAKRRGLARYAAVVLGTMGTNDDVPELEAALAHDEPLVRKHAAWALTEVAQRKRRCATRGRTRDRPKGRTVVLLHHRARSAGDGA